jgi:hypothetical protein
MESFWGKHHQPPAEEVVEVKEKKEEEVEEDYVRLYSFTLTTDGYTPHPYSIYASEEQEIHRLTDSRKPSTYKSCRC